MIKFGPSGNCQWFYDEKYKSSIQAPAWLNSIGLNAYEYPFTRGVNMKEDTAVALGEQAKKYNVEISVHAPYYINFAGTNDELLEKSYGYILNCLKFLRLMGGKRCVFHPGTCGKLPREQAFELLKQRIKKLVQRVKQEGFGDMYLCPETMGKSMQLGSYKEIAEICTYDDMLIPTIDFGHINSFEQGLLKDTEAFDSLIQYFIKTIGLEKVKKMHVHFSKIEYGVKGEIKHLTFEDKVFGPNFENLAPVLKKYDLQPFIICESNNTQAQDALIMKEIYQNTILN